MSAPKEIDRDDVLGELRHRWYGDGDPADMIRWTLDELVELDILRYREPADDPSKSEVGEVRQEGDHSVWQVEEREDGHRFWRCTHSTAPGNRGTTLSLSDATGWPVIGAVPGTPAAEQNPVPPPVLARVRELLTNGQKIRAVKVIREAAVGMGLKDAKAFAKRLPEWAVAERVNEERLRAAVLDDFERHDDGSDEYARAVAEAQADPHEPVVLKRADTAPPISSYSRHQQHTERHLDCEYCMRRGDQS